MILALLTGFVIGIAVAIPPGPVMFVIVRATLHHGKKYALKIAYGIALLDVLYSFIFSLATGRITTLLGDFAARFPTALLSFQVACILGLILYGIISLRANLKQSKNTPRANNPTTDVEIIDTNDDAPTLPAFMRTLAKHGPFFLGVALALTHLVNPTFVPLMTSVSYVAGHYGFLQEGALAQHICFALGYAGGVLAWLMTLVVVSLRYRHIFSDAGMRNINRLVGMTMIGVGTYWGFQRFELVLWTLRDILKLGLAF